jgi:phosphoenolpyruvate carboxykinase (ATP)
MVRAAVAGELADVATKTDPVFGLEIPMEIEGVPNEVLDPRQTWNDGAAYDAQAKKLADMFRENMKKFGDGVSPETIAAGPR